MSGIHPRIIDPLRTVDRRRPPRARWGHGDPRAPRDLARHLLARRARPPSPRSSRRSRPRCPTCTCGSVTSTCSSPMSRHPSTRSRPTSRRSSSRCCSRRATTCGSTCASSPPATPTSRSRRPSGPTRDSSTCSSRGSPHSSPAADDAIVLAVAGSSDDRANEDCRVTARMLVRAPRPRGRRSGFLAAAEPRLGAGGAGRARKRTAARSWRTTCSRPATSTISPCASPTAARSRGRCSTTTSRRHPSSTSSSTAIATSAAEAAASTP